MARTCAAPARRTAMRLLGAALFACGLLAGNGVAHAAGFSARTGTLSGFGDVDNTLWPDEAVAHSEGFNGSGHGYIADALAAPDRLQVRSYSLFGGTVAIGETSLLAGDIVIASTGGAASTVELGFSPWLRGLVDYRGSGNANGTLLAGWTLTQGAQSAGVHVNQPVQKDRTADGQPLPTPADVFNLPMAGSLTVEVGVPFRLAAYLELRGVGDSAFGFYGGGGFDGDFLTGEHGLRFDPNAFFALPVGYTAHSAALGLEDNRLLGYAAPIPEPGRWALMALGLGVLLNARRRQRAHQAASASA
ncbi:PEP-CTERM sorting domain-containing protein [Rubrivivax albus]|uniref:PEP-CTERM sorting domain-containing protein n=2 Tax=Rubrivivax albus TaxID=2499835 RepID=A0A437JSS4_9BURK|nr:PEP-CTERM sorting domain-containing protein [Rubrivivax albus]